MSEIISDDAGADTLAVTGTAGEVHLWQSVIVGAINDWRSGPLRLQRIAEHFLFEDNDDFPLVCSSAGIDYRRLRAGLGRLQNRLRHSARLAAA
jgi:hypothetical protein